VRTTVQSAALAALTIAAIAIGAAAQQIIGGHALDANLGVNSSGINAPSARATSGMINTRYNPSLRNANAQYNTSLQDSVTWRARVQDRRDTSYYTVTPTVSGSTAVPSSRVYSVGRSGASYNALAAPQYNAMRPGAVVQTGAGPLTVTRGGSGMSQPTYRAWGR
jgi:hypothetical protein